MKEKVEMKITYEINVPRNIFDRAMAKYREEYGADKQPADFLKDLANFENLGGRALFFKNFMGQDNLAEKQFNLSIVEFHNNLVETK